MFHLKELRLENGLKRSELARLLGIHHNTIANYENEERQASYEMLVLFADFFGVTVDELLGHEPHTAANPALPTAHEKRLLERYRALSEADKRRFEEVLSIFDRIQ